MKNTSLIPINAQLMSVSASCVAVLFCQPLACFAQITYAPIAYTKEPLTVPDSPGSSSSQFTLTTLGTQPSLDLAPSGNVVFWCSANQVQTPSIGFTAICKYVPGTAIVNNGITPVARTSFGTPQFVVLSSGLSFRKDNIVFGANGNGAGNGMLYFEVGSAGPQLLPMPSGSQYALIGFPSVDSIDPFNVYFSIFGRGIYQSDQLTAKGVPKLATIIGMAQVDRGNLGISSQSTVFAHFKAVSDPTMPDPIPVADTATIDPTVNPTLDPNIPNSLFGSFFSTPGNVGPGFQRTKIVFPGVAAKDSSLKGIYYYDFGSASNPTRPTSVSITTKNIVADTKTPVSFTDLGGNTATIKFSSLGDQTCIDNDRVVFQGTGKVGSSSRIGIFIYSISTGATTQIIDNKSSSSKLAFGGSVGLSIPDNLSFGHEAFAGSQLVFWAGKGSAQGIFLANNIPGGPPPPPPTVTVTTIDANTSGQQGAFTFLRTGNAPSDLTVNFSVGGSALPSYYNPLPALVVIPGGGSSATATLPVIATSLSQGQGNKTVVLTFTADPNFTISPNPATVTILDSTLPLVTVTVSNAKKSGQPGAFTFTRTGSTTAALTVSLTVGGSAIPGTASGKDYLPLATSVLIPGGPSPQGSTLAVQPTGTSIAGGDRTVILNFTPDSTFNILPNTAILTIVDDSVPGADNDWHLTGNSGTTPDNIDPAQQSFFGTIDTNPLAIRTANIERIRVDGSGNVGIGTSTPNAPLDVRGLVQMNDFQLNKPPINSFVGGYVLVSKGNGIGFWTDPASLVTLPPNVAFLNKNQTFTGSQTFSPGSGPPFAVENSTKVTGLNADLLDGLDSTDFAVLNANQTFTGANRFDNSNNSFAGDGSRLTGIKLGEMTADDFWQLGGNNVMPDQFLGSTNNQSLELKVFNQRALLLEPGKYSVNVIAGAGVNFAPPGVTGAAIGGGGHYAIQMVGAPPLHSSSNVVNANFGTIAGGSGNTVESEGGAIAGGLGNLLDHILMFRPDLPPTTKPTFAATIGGGEDNTNKASWAAISGGKQNNVGPLGSYSTISGGNGNTANGIASAVGGGQGNTAGAHGSVVPGGENNLALGEDSFAAGHGAKAANSGSFVWADNSTSQIFASTANNQFVVRAAGGVGIGTPSPMSDLHILSPNNPARVAIQSSQGFGSGKLEFWSDPQGSPNEWRPGSIRSVDDGNFTGGLSFLVNGSGNKTSEMEVMRLVNGRVGIGLPFSPTSTLDVNGDTLLRGGLEVIGDIHCDGKYYGRFSMDGNGNRHYFWLDTGRNNYPLSNPGDVVMWTESDQRLKQTIVSIPDALATVKRLHGVAFHWNEAGLRHLTRDITNSWVSASGKPGDNKALWEEKRKAAYAQLSKRQIGFIAQEVEKVMPDWVTTNEFGYKQVNMQHLDAVLVDAIKEQQAEIEAQKKEIAELKATQNRAVAEWEARLKNLETAVASIKAK